MPTFILKIKGKYAAKRPGAEGAFIKKLEDKLASIENSEVITAEGVLSPTRSKGASIISKVSKDMKEDVIVPEIFDGMSESEIRITRKIQSEKARRDSEIKDANNQLPSILETITHVDTILLERIAKSRNLATSTIMAYVEGINSRHEYIYHFDSEDKAYNLYKLKHHILDSAIEKAVFSKQITEED